MLDVHYWFEAEPPLFVLMPVHQMPAFFKISAILKHYFSSRFLSSFTKSDETQWVIIGKRHQDVQAPQIKITELLGLKEWISGT